MSEPLTRREILKTAAMGAGALGIGAAFPGSGFAARRERVAIIGAGTGGVAAAYFLAGTHDVDVFEARSQIGGHCDSRKIDLKGHQVTVDLGAQFFHPDTHPIYVTLLEELGLYEPSKPDSRQTHVATGSLCVFPMTGGGTPRFTSTYPLETLSTALAFASFTQMARQAVLDEMAWEITVEEWIDSLSLDPAFKSDVLYPWITATIGCPRADAAGVSARSILQTFALAFPADLSESATTYNSRIGLQGNLRRMLERTPAARIHRDSPVRALSRGPGGWTLQTSAGRQGPYRYVVMNAPPRVARRLLRPVTGLSDVTTLLDRFKYFESRLLIHRDPAYVNPQRKYWTAYNAGVDGLECEGSAWIGALHDPCLPGGPSTSSSRGPNDGPPTRSASSTSGTSSTR